MQINNRILDDLTRVTNSALGTMTGVKGEVDAMIRQQFEKILLNMDLVTREEYDVVHDVAVRAAERIDALEAKIADLEKRLDATEPAKKPAAKRSTAKAAPKAAPKTAAKKDA
ncbi:MAG: accessory factor UbiK family protein [Thalassospira sp.]|uniref:accessory factor UbiK family protein n=1 Tax=Thalassospira TaxID=168934 RepID=UPI0002F6BCAE|nr:MULTISPECIES: accessory factor UbiK family protein [Thalassospira]MBO6579619.1 accessory factor UbiK family protein [Thalassospira sp.]MBO6802617.1 accessory factor UbiK family protein [Thalassospira sp.]MBO6817183.1 accessory factor UbiK family protein [Thalassospira sp.]MBO6888537.1 accessory factor UbiK family protein [Thalassospira sp.]